MQQPGSSSFQQSDVTRTTVKSSGVQQQDAQPSVAKGVATINAPNLGIATQGVDSSRFLQLDQERMTLEREAQVSFTPLLLFCVPRFCAPF